MIVIFWGVIHLQANTMVTLRELLEMYGIAATGMAYKEKALDRDMRNLLQVSPPFAEVGTSLLL
jgi:hypothetical protein